MDKATRRASAIVADKLPAAAGYKPKSLTLKNVVIEGAMWLNYKLINVLQASPL